MALDPAFANLLALPNVELAPPPPETGAAGLRALLAANKVVGPRPQVARVREVFAQHGEHRVRIRIYYPTRRKKLPVLVYFHGGGFVLCDLDTHDGFCRDVALASGIAVASVDYRLAPEHAYPVPLEDCYAATKWLSEQGSTLGLDAARLAVGGDSAGGNLAAAVALLARERRGPRISHQLLLFPSLDPDCNSASMREFSQGYLLSARMMAWYWQCYLGDLSCGREELASPLRAQSMANLPATSVVTAEFDPLRDEGERYADLLRKAGVMVTARRYLGVIHGFCLMPFVSNIAYRMIEDVAADLRASMCGPGADRHD